MKISNTTEWPDYMLRRMVAWCCRQLKLPVRAVRKAEFGKRTTGCWNGRAWCRQSRIRIVVGPASCFPVEPFHYPGRTSDAFLSPRVEDRIEALIKVTAHELAHLRRWKEDRYTSVKRAHGERHTRFEERRVLELFRPLREQLLADWAAPPAAKSVKQKPTRQQANEAKVRNLLAAWERKLKLAKTKVGAYRRKVRYYDRVAADR